MQSKVSVTVSAPTTVVPPRFKQVQWRDFVVYIFFAVVLGFFALTIGDKGFLSVANLFNITRTTSMIAIMAVVESTIDEP